MKKLLVYYYLYYSLLVRLIIWKNTMVWWIVKAWK